MYMDNICTSVLTKEEVKNPVKDVDEMLAEKGFKVKGWQSNEPLTDVTSQMSKDTNILENVNKEKVLGMVWHRNLHEFSYRVKRSMSPDQRDGAKSNCQDLQSYRIRFSIVGKSKDRDATPLTARC